MQSRSTHRGPSRRWTRSGDGRARPWRRTGRDRRSPTGGSGEGQVVGLEEAGSGSRKVGRPRWGRRRLRLKEKAATSLGEAAAPVEGEGGGILEQRRPRQLPGGGGQGTGRGAGKRGRGGVRGRGGDGIQARSREAGSAGGS
nr:uncharacterized protein LOC127303602 [Lolium perenne]